MICTWTWTFSQNCAMHLWMWGKDVEKSSSLLVLATKYHTNMWAILHLEWSNFSRSVENAKLSQRMPLLCALVSRHWVWNESLDRGWWLWCLGDRLWMVTRRSDGSDLLQGQLRVGGLRRWSALLVVNAQPRRLSCHLRHLDTWRSEGEHQLFCHNLTYDNIYCAMWMSEWVDS